MYVQNHNQNFKIRIFYTNVHAKITCLSYYSKKERYRLILKLPYSMRLMTNQNNNSIQVLRTASTSSKENYVSRKAAKERHQFLATYVTELITLQHRAIGQFCLSNIEESQLSVMLQ